MFLAFLIALMYGHSQTVAFTSSPRRIFASSSTSQRIRSPEPLYMAKSTKSSAAALSRSQSKRLSQEEEQHLLRQAAELRRLLDLEKELALQSPSLPLLSARAKAAGYGTDVEAYEQAMDDGHKAREKLVTSNIGLVHYSVGEIMGKKRASLNSLAREDLIQEGAIGLARAVDKYKLGMGTKFSTYAVYWVRAAILRCIAERDDIMRVPEHVSAAVRKVSGAAQRLGLELDGDKILNTFSSDSLWKEAQAAKVLAEEAGVTDKQLAQALRVKERRKMGGYISYEAWMQNGKNMEVDLASAEETPSSVDSEHLTSVLSNFLRPKEMEALSWRYGLKRDTQYRDYLSEAEEAAFGSRTVEPVKGKWGEAMSFTEVGKQMSISAEYGRRLCHAALEKLKRAAAEGQLEPALLY